MLASLFLALSLATLPVGWNYNVTECINSSGVPVRSLHEGDHFAILGSSFGTTPGSVTHCWGNDVVLQWSDTRVDAIAGAVFPGMESGAAPLVVLPADGTHCLSAFRVELRSVTVRAMPGAPAAPSIQAPSIQSPSGTTSSFFDHGLKQFFAGR